MAEPGRSMGQSARRRSMAVVNTPTPACAPSAAGTPYSSIASVNASSRLAAMAGSASGRVMRRKARAGVRAEHARHAGKAAARGGHRPRYGEIDDGEEVQSHDQHDAARRKQQAGQVHARQLRQVAARLQGHGQDRAGVYGRQQERGDQEGQVPGRREQDAAQAAQRAHRDADGRCHPATPSPRRTVAPSSPGTAGSAKTRRARRRRHPRASPRPGARNTACRTTKANGSAALRHSPRRAPNDSGATWSRCA